MSNWSFVRSNKQIGALPLHLKVWLVWLVVITMLVPIYFSANAFFLAVLGCQAANFACGMPLMLRYGLVKLLSLAHILFWTPMLGKFVWYYESMNSPLLLTFGWILTLTVAVSLLLDFRDFFQWMRGDRSPVGTR